MIKKVLSMNYYIHKQRNYFSCGPVALLNALKWRGDKATYDSHYKKLVKECKTTRDGTESAHFEKILGRYKFEFTKSRLYKDVQVHMRNGGAMILSHLDSENDWHFSFWYDYRLRKFYGANIDYSLDMQSVDEKAMRKYLLKTGIGNHFQAEEGHDYPEAILIVPS